MSKIRSAERELDRGVSWLVEGKWGEGGTYAQTCDPTSGITVKRTVSSSRRIQAIFSREFNAAVSSAKHVSNGPHKWQSAGNNLVW